MNYNPLTLAIDTSCDETSAAVVEGFNVLSNLLPSQSKIHSQYGGVVPNLARLAHQERIDGVVEQALKRAGIFYNDVDQIAVTYGPGLAIALEVGILKAKELSTKYNKPLIAINHMEGHLFSGLALNSTQKATKLHYNSPSSFLTSAKYPMLGLLVSGKHTEIILIKEFGNYEIIGETVDDACGEAFDKCGRLLGLGYPAGPIVAEFAKQNRKNFKFEIIKKNLSTILVSTNVESSTSYELPIPMANSGDLNFSYSGLKTAFRQLVDSISSSNFDIEQNRIDAEQELSKSLTKQQIFDLSVAFEEAAFTPIEMKLNKAIQKFKPNGILLGGGVVASSRLKSKIRKIANQNSIEYIYPTSKKLTTDNAAMIGIAANLRVLSQTANFLHPNSSELENLDRDPSLVLGES